MGPTQAQQHLARSHAHEEDIPGTVNLQAQEGDDTALGQALFPVPADDPNDPLQWPNWKKTTILVLLSFYSFLGNSALLGPSFGISPTTASNLISYPNLIYGFGSLLLVPAYLKFGRRPVMLVSMTMYVFGLLGASRAHSYGGLMAARLVHALGSGVCEALPVQLVNDIFFLHERSKRIGYYTIALCWGATGPLYAGYMLAGGYSWRLYFYVVLAFAAALLVLSFIFVEETMYKRDTGQTSSNSSDSSDKDVGEKMNAVERLQSVPVPPRKTFRKQLGGLAFNYTFPIKIVAPPYNWSPEISGLIALGNVIGYGLAIPFTSTSDYLAARLTRKNNCIREAEMRLGVMLPAMVIGPIGLIVYGMVAQQNLHWIGYFAGVTMVDWASYFYFTFALAYSVDSYNANTSEMLIAINLGKQATTFGMGFKLLDWILESGYANVIAGAFAVVLVLSNFALLLFMWKGKSICHFFSQTWLARTHKKTIRAVETA
ncbi:major facilitator superfamily domain-containing protein [Phyllosticta citrichinensis]|uniref:Major facilitator superfamily domain-containing protein n=1 Tax=Phyllosticta citrichinensis TaxID=1130410 RepID=A0ABR1Y8D6_9PEZI